MLALLYLLVMTLPGSITWCPPSCGAFAIGIAGSCCAECAPPACCATCDVPDLGLTCCQDWDDVQQAHVIADSSAELAPSVPTVGAPPTHWLTIPCLTHRDAGSHGRPFFEPDRARMARTAPQRTVILRI